MEGMKIKKEDPRLEELNKLLNEDHKEIIGYLMWDRGMIKSQIIKAFETGGTEKAKRYIEHISNETPLDLILEKETVKKVFELLEISKT